jgi:hypothetical protein
LVEILNKKEIDKIYKAKHKKEKYNLKSKGIKTIINNNMADYWEFRGKNYFSVTTKLLTSDIDLGEKESISITRKN